LPLIFLGDKAAKSYVGDDFPAFPDTKDAYLICAKHSALISEINTFMDALGSLLVRLQGDSIDAPAAIFEMTCQLFSSVLRPLSSDSVCLTTMKKRMSGYLLKPPSSYQSKQQGNSDRVFF
jgi:hypothetical protein